MDVQKREIIDFVKVQRSQGCRVTEVLAQLGIKRSTYYSWLKPRRTVAGHRVTEIIPKEKEAIMAVKEEFPGYRHRQLQGVLQQRGIYVSCSAVYQCLKSAGLVELYARRPSPLKEPSYSVVRRNLMWGCDWTKILVNHIRWYLLAIIDFFSRYVVAYGIYPSINASHVKHVYQIGLTSQGIERKDDLLPELRVDGGSPNTSWVTKEFFTLMGAEISFARVRRPTDNAVTERFFGTVKQEETYVVGSYPDELSAWEEIGNYIHFYNHQRSHQALWNFTPAHVHEINNKSRLLEELNRLKEETKLRRKAYWGKQQTALNITKSDSQNFPILSIC